jgi:hypothetical protein
MCQLHTLAVRGGIPVWADCVFGGRTVTFAEAVVNGQALRHDETGKLAAFNIYFPQSSSAMLMGVSDKSPREGSRKKHPHLRALDDKVIFPITRIESFVYEGFVHDIEVEEDHSYQVHGFGVSNCQVEFTICTACGNVAYDETQLCNHIHYFKGNEFVDALGRKRKIAELCGHVLAEPGSVKFIEASWVANPAFEGAVLRDILNPEEVADLGRKMSIAFSGGPRVMLTGAMGKAASFPAAQGQQGQPGQQGQGFDDGMDKKPAPAPTGDPASKAVDELADALRQRAVDKVREEMKPEPGPRPNENRNNTLLKEALRYPSWRLLAHRVHVATGRDHGRTLNVLLGLIHYKSGGWQAVRSAGCLTGPEVLAVARFLESSKRITQAGESRLYRAVLAAGSVTSYPDDTAFVTACRTLIGRNLTPSEQETLLDKGRLYALGTNNPSLTPRMARNGA